VHHRGGRLGARGAHNILLAIADEAGVNDDLTAHVLRHTFGTALVRTDTTSSSSPNSWAAPE